MHYESDNMMGIRRANRAAVLLCLHEQGALSRKRLAEQLSLSPAGISKIVSELIGETPPPSLRGGDADTAIRPSLPEDPVIAEIMARVEELTPDQQRLYLAQLRALQETQDKK